MGALRSARRADTITPGVTLLVTADGTLAVFKGMAALISAAAAASGAIAVVVLPGCWAGKASTSVVSRSVHPLVTFPHTIVVAFKAIISIIGHFRPLMIAIKFAYRALGTGKDMESVSAAYGAVVLTL